jgi:hypothetical protein
MDQIAALKAYTIATDLHLEAFLPLQTSVIAFEVAAGVVKRDRQEKYKKHFTNKIIR